MMPYQQDAFLAFVNLLPKHTVDILEIGSDLAGKVTSALARKTGSRIIGMNPTSDFPAAGETGAETDSPFFIRGNGLSLPFPNGSFDAVISIATLEHVNGIRRFMSEIERERFEKLAGLPIL